MNKKKRNDYLLIASCLLSAILLLFFQSGFFVNKGGEVSVTYHSKEIGRYSLHQNIMIPVEEDGAYNLIEIVDGKAIMKEANCKDGQCMKQKAISLKGESIICLPNKLVITVENGTDSQLDGISF